MTIIFHCQSCKKKIKAPDKKGGKWGNCPHCGLDSYIPMPPSDEQDELKLVPLEEEAKRQYEEKMQQMRKVQMNILQETADTDSAEAIGFSYDKEQEKKLWKNIVSYLRYMADGQLDEAEQKVSSIKRFPKHAKEILAKISRAEVKEPDLADISPAVLKGLIRNLITEINSKD